MTKTKFILTSIAVTFAVSFLAVWLFSSTADSIPYSNPEAVKGNHADYQKACQGYVDGAVDQANLAINRRSLEFASFIDSRKHGAKPFAEDIVSWHGKWRAVAPYLPFTAKDGHKKFVENKFEKHIFTQDELLSAMKLSIENGAKDIEGIENNLAVSLRTEIQGRSLSPNEMPMVTKEFRTPINEVMAASRQDAALAAGGLVVAEVASQVVSQVMLRIGVSAGILSAGGINAWWSLGGALLIGVLADMAWGYVQDTQGDIERKTVTALDELSSLSSASMNDEMKKIVAQRSTLWNAKIKEICI